MRNPVCGRGVRWAASCLAVGGLLALTSGGDATSRALSRARELATRPTPVAPRRELPQPDTTWVPDRYLRIPGEPGEARVPAHWERRISDREFHVPPLTIFNPVTGTARGVPAGIRGPVESRHGP